jgi:rhodanese-related sulfurtransferase
VTPLGTIVDASSGLSTIRLRNCTLILHRHKCRNPEGSASLYLVSDKPVQLVDVRNPEEWDAGHLEAAVNIPLAELRERLGELDPGLPVLTVCQTGRRSEQAVDLLTAIGFDAEHLEGGTRALLPRLKSAIEKG